MSKNKNASDMLPHRIFHPWVLVRPCEDIPGEWVAHCLDLDVVTQGTSLEHALTMILEASQIKFQADLQAERDPFARRAPDEYWSALWALIHDPQTILGSVQEMVRDAPRVDAAAVQLLLMQSVAAREPSPEAEIKMVVSKRSPAHAPC